VCVLLAECSRSCGTQRCDPGGIAGMDRCRASHQPVYRRLMSSPLSELANRFAARLHSGPDGRSLPYRMLLPRSVEAPLPLVLLLHGAGERGEDNVAQLGNGAAEWLGSDDAQRDFPCVFVLPQCPASARWVEVDWSAARHDMPLSPSQPLLLVQTLIDELLATQPIDPRRLYVVGLSMGGYGTWDLISRLPQRFAAAVPICGGGDPSQASGLVHLPLWAFHGAQDPVVSVERSRQMIQRLRSLGGQPRYTELPEVAHDAWNTAFSHPDLRPWLFAQRRA